MFCAHAGRSYAMSRNTDLGPSDRSNVSALSPWIRRRLVTEEDVLRAVLAEHDADAARAFIHEVFWRTYWKGWLELRPAVYLRYQADLAELDARLAADDDLRNAVHAAVEGQTGLDVFDVWAHELKQTGYLHNHARMWFASVWIFTLRLPWQLGARHFHDWLIDADPASNTLSWRWVAGLHTRGKNYLARAANIREHTLGRLDPAGRLQEEAGPLSEAEPPPPGPAPAGETPQERRFGLLLHEDDLSAETWAPRGEVCGVAGVAGDGAGTPGALFSAGALEDALSRSARAFDVPCDIVDEVSIVRWAAGLGVNEVVTAFAPIGPHRERVDRLADILKASGVRLVRVMRPYDRRAWPRATGGFFRFREHIPRLLADLGRP
jgi:deoxyribodipyrimidine photo-lyase